MRINFDFLDLEAFLAIRETGSFHLAAERLNLSQSSITRRVQKLEDALGTPLFDRTTRAVRPTLAAKRLHLRAEAILQDARETTRALRDETEAFAHQRARTVTLAAIPTVVSTLVGPAISKLQTTGAAPRVRLLDLAANEVAEAVAEGEADFGIGSVPMLEPVTEFELLFDDPLILAVAIDDTRAKTDALRWRDLSTTDLILPARGTGNRMVIDEALARSPEPLHWRYEVGRSTTALELVTQNVGAAVLPRMAVQDHLLDKVRCVPLVAPKVTRPVGIISRIGQIETPPVRAFMAALRDRAPFAR